MTDYKKGDEFNTQQELKRRSAPVDGKNWLRHEVGKGTAAIDKLLLDGATMEQLRAGAGRGAVETHLTHLKTVHGLTILKNENERLIFAPKQPKKAK